MLGYLSMDYLFREANSFPRVWLKKTSELLETDIVQGQNARTKLVLVHTQPSIFLCQMKAIVFIIFQIFFATDAVFKLGNITWIFPKFYLGHFQSHDTFRPMACEQK